MDSCCRGLVAIFSRYTVKNKKIEILYISGQHYQQPHFLSTREARIPGMKAGKDCPAGLARILSLHPCQWSYTAGKSRRFAGNLIFLAWALTPSFLPLVLDSFFHTTIMLEFQQQTSCLDCIHSYHGFFFHLLCAGR